MHGNVLGEEGRNGLFGLLGSGRDGDALVVRVAVAVAKYAVVAVVVVVVTQVFVVVIVSVVVFVCVVFVGAWRRLLLGGDWRRGSHVFGREGARGDARSRCHVERALTVRFMAKATWESGTIDG